MGYTRKNIPNARNIEKELKTERLNLRASGTTINKLAWIHEHSSKCQHMSDAEIIAYLVDEHVMMQELFNYNLPRFKNGKS